MKASDKQLVAAFIDGELAGEELATFEIRLGSEPGLREAVETAAEDFDFGGEIREVFAGGDVIAHDLGNIDVPNAEAFNSDILSRIKNETGGEPAHG